MDIGSQAYDQHLPFALRKQQVAKVTWVYDIKRAVAHDDSSPPWELTDGLQYLIDRLDFVGESFVK